MEIKDENTIEDFNKTPEAVEQVFEEHKKKRFDSEFRKSEPFLYSLAVIVGIVCICLCYFFSSVSKVKAIAINGNYYLEEEYVRQLSGLSLESRYYLTIPYFVEKNLKKSELVADAKVGHDANNVITISIVEKQPIGYRYEEEPYILFSDGSTTPLKSEYLSIISYVPLINGFQDEDSTRLLAKAFKNVDQKMIEQISEIEQYPMNYDENTIRLFMRDGNYFFASFYSLEAINMYNQFASNFESNGICVFSDEGVNVAYSKVCPWNETPLEIEYWVDDTGAYILNMYGDKVSKHYYYDKDGQPLLDEEGNAIPIPLDENGKEVTEMPENAVQAEQRAEEAKAQAQQEALEEQDG